MASSRIHWLALATGFTTLGMLIGYKFSQELSNVGAQTR